MQIKFSKKMLISILILAIIFISTCFVVWYAISKNNNFEHKIVEWINKSCESQTSNCVIKITDITPFSWDKMYFFDGGEAVDLEKIMGVRPADGDIVKRKIVFVKDSKIVFYDELPTNIEGSINNQVYFDNLSDSKNYKVFTPETAIFTVNKKEWGRSTIYELTSINFL